MFIRKSHYKEIIEEEGRNSNWASVGCRATIIRLWSKGFLLLRNSNWKLQISMRERWKVTIQSYISLIIGRCLVCILMKQKYKKANNDKKLYNTTWEAVLCTQTKWCLHYYKNLIDWKQAHTTRTSGSKTCSHLRKLQSLLFLSKSVEEDSGVTVIKWRLRGRQERGKERISSVQ